MSLSFDSNKTLKQAIPSGISDVAGKVHSAVSSAIQGSASPQTTIIDIPIPKVDTTELEVVHVFPQGMGPVTYSAGYQSLSPNYYNQGYYGTPSFSIVNRDGSVATLNQKISDINKDKSEAILSSVRTERSLKNSMNQQKMKTLHLLNESNKPNAIMKENKDSTKKSLQFSKKLNLSHTRKKKGTKLISKSKSTIKQIRTLQSKFRFLKI